MKPLSRLAFLLLVALLAACGQATTPTSAPSNTPRPADTATPAPAQAEVQQALPTDTAIPTQQPTAVTQDDNKPRFINAFATW